MYEYDEWKILEIPWVYKKNFTLIILYFLHWFFFQYKEYEIHLHPLPLQTKNKNKETKKNQRPKTKLA